MLVLNLEMGKWIKIGESILRIGRIDIDYDYVRLDVNGIPHYLRPNQQITVNNIDVKILKIETDRRLRLGFNGPREIPIVRSDAKVQV